MVGRNGKCAVGIDIAFDAIRVAELEMKTSLRVQSISAHPVGLGAFGQDRSVNWAALESALREILQRYKLKGKRTHVAIPSAYTVIRQLSLPDFSDAELREVISFELTNSIHLPFPEVVFDFVRCPKGGDGGPDDGNRSVILIAADRIFVDELIKCLNGAGVRPVSIDVRPLAMYRVLRRLSTLPSTFLMTDVDATGTRIHVFHDGLLYLTRDVPIQLAGSADGMGFGEVGAAQERGESGELATAVPVESLTAAAYVERLGAELDRTLNFFRYTLNQLQRNSRRRCLRGVDAFRWTSSTLSRD
ncbi:pilus assembly protein PilM [Alicyclobacillus fastidiosus]|uniref:Pilus assembly protein PilM n=1 Tax=Alicyclobacillus fastidiosus TaxID=392011 RepID=A0ABY6ZFL4_9BACL|nr:pilus assembly protein PilM [Alicyclobacillus fastidiosus]WAH41704.1 pilus assembly protein PilM [Alicyclobacillus fastidiosus]GMA63383.1 hypothetical protein GCM10025859_38230 [Alicyclobacillus fastidiosus]